jgi:hypothetical protein
MIEGIDVVGKEEILAFQLNQDLHIHTVFSVGDGAVVAQMTVELVAAMKHACVVGISDHFESLANRCVDEYLEHVRSFGLKAGTEVDGGEWTAQACQADVDYYIYHCRDREIDYKGAEKLLSTGKPVIIAHPLALQTNFNRLPSECYVEINNRYTWRNDWQAGYSPIVNRFRFVLGSDAHQPHWLNQNFARYVANQLGICETLIFVKD